MTIGNRTLVAIAAASIALAVAAPVPARAQSVEAEALFREGRRLMKEGKIAEACDKLEASDHLESSAGTLLNLADCREKNHQLATAWATFLKASAAAKKGGDAKRDVEAKRRAGALEGKLAYLTIAVPDKNKVDGLVIKRNGVAVDPVLWNQSIPVDAGRYEIAASAPGLDAFTTSLDVTDGQKATADVPRLAAHAVVKPPDVAKHDGGAIGPIAHEPDHAEPQPPPDEPVDEGAHPGTFTGTRKLAVAAIVVGAGGIAIGAIFGGKANDLEKQSDAICPDATCDDPTALQLNKDARSDATLANVGFIGGGVALAAGAALWFLGAPKIADQPVAITPVVRGDQVGVSIGGSF